jgi:hypothetical protein
VLSTWIGTVVGSLTNFAINKMVGLLGAKRARHPVSKLLVATAVYLGWNYPLNRWFVFRAAGQAGHP